MIKKCYPRFYFLQNYTKIIKTAWLENESAVLNTSKKK